LIPVVLKNKYAKNRGQIGRLPTSVNVSDQVLQGFAAFLSNLFQRSPEPFFEANAGSVTINVNRVLDDQGFLHARPQLAAAKSYNNGLACRCGVESTISQKHAPRDGGDVLAAAEIE
jgi:hypothetical protein